MNDHAHTNPARLRLSRAGGFNLQAESLATNGLPAVSVARWRHAKFGNPFTIAGCREAGFTGSDTEIARRCVHAFRVWIDTRHWRENWGGEDGERARNAMLAGIPSLRGKNLACWCGLNAPCHADVLLEIANRPICDAPEARS
jgi:hypothetical protein